MTDNVTSELANLLLAVQSRNMTWYSTALDGVADTDPDVVIDTLQTTTFALLGAMAQADPSTITDIQLDTLADQLAADLYAWEPQLPPSALHAVLYACVGRDSHIDRYEPAALFVACSYVAAELLPTDPHQVMRALHNAYAQARGRST